MKNIESLISVLSWEERFILGLEENLKKFKTNEIVFFQYKGYEGRNRKNREAALKLCRRLGITHKILSLDFTTPKENWIVMRDLFSKKYIAKNILVDITTMPRETTWLTLFFLEQAKAKIDYVYYSPEMHNKEWVSRDPSDPRLLYKMSGICELGKPTMLFLFNGHDYQRVSNVINFFEPQKIVLASQSDHKNQIVINQCLREFDGNISIDQFELNTYDANNCFEIISKKVEENMREYNIIFSSLGPKISAIPLFRINRAYPETALCYVPCKEFSENYSSGICLEKTVSGTLEIPSRKFAIHFEE